MADKNMKAIIGWSLYDWANSAFATAVMAGFFPVFFNQFWSIGVDSTVSTARLGAANSIAALTVAGFAPVLGAIADRGSYKKNFLLFFASLGIGMTISLYGVDKGNWLGAVVFYILAIIGFSGGNLFYDALLPNVADKKNMDFISSLGFSVGYIGGGILFAVNVWMALRPELFGFTDATAAVKFSFLTVGLWWSFFSIPLFVYVNEPPATRRISIIVAVKTGWLQFVNTFREIRRYKNIFLFLCAYWLYIDGVHTIIRMAIAYGISIGFDSNDLILALLITQFVGFPSAIAFGWLATRIGARRSIFAAIAVYLFVSIWGAFIQDRYEFYILAVIVGLVQGGIQALSRSYYARIIPLDKAAEYFGFYNMIGKFAAVIGPIAMGGVGLLARSMAFSSDTATRISIASVSLLFITGGLIFHGVSKEICTYDRKLC